MPCVVSMTSLACLVLALTVAYASARDVFVTIETGVVKGRTFTVPNEEGEDKVVNRFHGIPYAKPPTGSRRWQPPEKAEAWSNVLDANPIPAGCPQGRFSYMTLFLPKFSKFNEDCLTVNVYAPNDTAAGPYPVLFFIHGGAHQSGANVVFPGHVLATRDVIVVSTNFRLGPLGFMSTGDSVAPGNYGLMDQLLALQWTRDNIAVFGGDPQRVTIAGQSSGAASVGLLMNSPQAHGLVHGAITQSGNEFVPWAINGEAEHPGNYTRQVAAKLGCPTSDSKSMMECLRAVDADKIIATSFEPTPGYGMIGFSPVVDGHVIPKSPYQLRREGATLKVPLMTGVCAEDGSYGLLDLNTAVQPEGFTRETFLKTLRTTTLGPLTPKFPDKIDDVMEAFTFQYSPWPHIHDTDLNRDQIVKLSTDTGFGLHMDTQVKFHSNITDQVYMYVMGYRGNSFPNRLFMPKWMGVTHGLDVPFMVGYPQIEDSEELKDDTHVQDVFFWNDEDILWSNYLIKLWTNFAKYGTPTPSVVKPPGDNEPATWPVWNKDNQEYLHIDRTTQIRKNYRQKTMAFYKNYISFVTGGVDFGEDLQ